MVVAKLIQLQYIQLMIAEVDKYFQYPLTTSTIFASKLFLLENHLQQAQPNFWVGCTTVAVVTGSRCRHQWFLSMMYVAMLHHR